MIQVHYTYCARCFYYYYISSSSDHQALGPRGWGPLPRLRVPPVSHPSLEESIARDVSSEHNARCLQQNHLWVLNENRADLDPSLEY